MKRQILDAPFDGDVLIPMEKGEVVLWEENPKHQLKIFDSSSYATFIKAAMVRLFLIFSGLGFVFVILSGFISIINKELLHHAGTFIFISSSAAFVSSLLFSRKEYITYKKRSKTKYIITSKKLVFELWWKKKRYLYLVPLDEIDYVQELIVGLTENGGNIFLTVKNPPKDEDYDFVYDKENDKITLEGLENALQVTNILKQAIAKHKAI